MTDDIEKDERMDDLERFIIEEKGKTEEELREVQDELLKVYNSLTAYLEVLDYEIKDAFEKSDDKKWLAFTNKKHIILHHLTELERIIKKP